MALYKRIVMSAPRAVYAAAALSRALAPTERGYCTPAAKVIRGHGYVTYQREGRRHNSSSAIEAELHKRPLLVGRLEWFDSHLNRPEKLARSIKVSKFLRFAIQEDVRQLFEESGFPVEQIVMTFDSDRGLNTSACIVVTYDEVTASAAIRELDGASLFDAKVCVSPEIRNLNNAVKVCSLL